MPSRVCVFLSRSRGEIEWQIVSLASPVRRSWIRFPQQDVRWPGCLSRPERKQDRLVPPIRIERTTRGLGNRCSIQLSYGGVDRTVAHWQADWKGRDRLLALPSAAASAGEDLSLSVGVPTCGAKFDGGMGQSVDRFHPLFDDDAAIRAGSCCCLRLSFMRFDHHAPSPWCSGEYVDCTRMT